MIQLKYYNSIYILDSSLYELQLTETTKKSWLSY